MVQMHQYKTHDCNNHRCMANFYSMVSLVTHCCWPRRRGIFRRASALFALAISSFWAIALNSQSSPDKVSSAGKRALQDLHDQRPDLAIGEYKKILEADPHNVDARSNLGLAYYMQQNFVNAADQFEIVIKSASAPWNIIALCGISEARSERAHPAAEHLEQAFAHVEDKSLRVVVGKQLYSLKYEARDYPAAAGVVALLQTLDPTDPDVLFAAHQVYSMLESRTFTAMADLDPLSPRMYQIRGDRQALRGNFLAAIASYRAAIAKDQHLSGVHFALGEVLSFSSAASEREKAAKEYKLALSDNPADEKAECRLGDIASQKGDIQAATAHYRRALTLQPDDPDANDGLGAALLSRELFAEASDYLKRAIELDPANIVAYYHLSQASRNLGKTDEANAAMAEFIKRKAIRDLQRRDFENAQATAKEAEEVNRGKNEP